jgi:hypothetical protein
MFKSVKKLSQKNRGNLTSILNEETYLKIQNFAKLDKISEQKEFETLITSGIKYRELEKKVGDRGVNNLTTDELRLEVARLTVDNEKWRKRAFELETENASLHYKLHLLFEDNRALTTRLIGYRAENEAFEKLLIKHGIIQPTDFKDEEKKKKEEYEKLLNRYVLWAKKEK